MAMLAEPRRRQKWSVDPRNSTWTKDESKFGQKMLEKMGWSKGKGLGKDEQGATENIKVKVKNNTLGLGTDVNHEDNWIAHQDDFNQILADLNNCHGQNEHVTEEKTSFSLEEKSKTSRKRVHYMKFTKGKDLSSRSETDLACIFGKRAKKSKDKEENNGQYSQGEKELEEEEENDTPCSEVEVTVNTVTSTLTMQEYFAQRMAQLKNERNEKRSPTTNPDTSRDSLDAIDTKHEISKKKKKKKSKNKDKDIGKEETGDCIGSPDGEEHEEKEHEQSGRSTGGKKKRRRSIDKEETGGSTTSSYEEHLDAGAGAGAGGGKEVQHYTDRKRKKHKKPSKESDVRDEHTVVLEETGDLDRPEKGRKRKKEEEAQEASEEKKGRKDKKKKRKHELLNGN